jgi:hypothetical protein
VLPGMGRGEKWLTAASEVERLQSRVTSLSEQLAGELVDRQRMVAELSRIETVINRAGVPIPRDGRAMHDWLAQVLQVLVGARDNARFLIDRIAAWPCEEPAQTSGCECASCLCRESQRKGANG